MYLKSKIRQHRRDFVAVYACSFCDHEQQGEGYDDAYFHTQVIPAMPCGGCGKTGGHLTSSPDVPAGVVL